MPSQEARDTDVLSAPLTIEFPFKRTLGPVLSAFFTALREQTLVGVRMADGRVMCPPVEYDPVTSESLTELVPVGQSGVVTTWSWVGTPQGDQPLDRPFAWALITLDGADTGMLHAVDAASPDAMFTGMRVTVRWAEERSGLITDIACFVPEEAA